MMGEHAVFLILPIKLISFVLGLEDYFNWKKETQAGEIVFIF